MDPYWGTLYTGGHSSVILTKNVLFSRFILAAGLSARHTSWYDKLLISHLMSLLGEGRVLAALPSEAAL